MVTRQEKKRATEARRQARKAAEDAARQARKQATLAELSQLRVKSAAKRLQNSSAKEILRVARDRKLSTAETRQLAAQAAGVQLTPQEQRIGTVIKATSSRRRQAQLTRQNQTPMTTGVVEQRVIPLAGKPRQKPQRQAFIDKRTKEEKKAGFQRELTPFEKRVFRQERTEQALVQRQQQITTKLGLADDEKQSRLKRFAKALGRSITEAPTNLIITGGRIALAGDAAVNRRFKGFQEAAKQWVPELKRAFDITTPDGQANLVLTAATIGVLGKVRGVQRAANKINADISNGRAQVAAVKTKPAGKNVEVTRVGTIKGKSGTRYPFKETIKINKAKLKQGDLIAKGKVRIRVSPKKTTDYKLKLKGKTVQAPGRKAQPGIPGRKAQRLTRVKVITRKGLSVRKRTISQTATKGKLISVLEGKNPIITQTTIKSLGRTGLTVQSTRFLQRLSPRQKASLRTRLARSIARTKNALTKKNLKAVYNKISLKTKKGTQAIGRPAGLGRETGALTKGKGSFSNVDKILKKFEAQTKQLEKIQGKQKALQKSRPRSISLKPEQVLTQNFEIVQGRILFIPEFSLLTRTQSQLQPAARARPTVTDEGRAGTGSRGGTTTDDATTPIPDTPAKPATTNLINNFFTNPPAIIPLLPVLPPFIPFINGVPLPTPAGGPGVFSIPTSRLPKRVTYTYTADLHSKLYGIKATPAQRQQLLRTGRIFTGLEARPIV